MELNNELRKMRRKAREAKNKNAEAKRTAGFLLLFIATAMLIVAVVGCAEKDKSEVVVKEEPELPEMSAHAGDEVDIDEPIEYSATEDTFEITAGAAADEYPNLNTDVTEADAADVPQDAELVGSVVSLEDNPNELFKVSQEWAAEHDGLYGMIDGEFYSLTNQLPSTIVDKYDVGYVIAPEGSSIDSDTVDLFFTDVMDVIDGVPTDARMATVTIGDFSPLKLRKKDDKIVVFGNGQTLFFKMEFVGYTIPAAQLDVEDGYYPIVDHIKPNNKIIEHPGLFTLDEQPVEDVRKLEYGEKYLYEYYIGTDYYEIETVANARCYKALQDSVGLEMLPTKLGYFEIDISGLEPGFYSPIGMEEAVFEIVD